jgi:hypothetical protein
MGRLRPLRLFRVGVIQAYRHIPGRYRRTCPHGHYSCSAFGLDLARAGATLAVISWVIVTTCGASGGCASASAGGGDPGSQGTPEIRHYARLVMEQLGAPAHGPSSSANIDSFAAWAGLENTPASWNPLATTMPEPGSTNFNEAGPVQNYADEGTGVKATADTIAGYSDLASAFRSGAGVCGGAYADSFHAWSAGPAAPMSEGYTEVC